MNERDLTIELMALPFGAPAAFATAVAERCLRHEADQDPYGEEPENRLLTLCSGVVADLWSAHFGDEDAFFRVSRAVATYYLSPFWRRTYMDQSARSWEDGLNPAVQITLYAALSYLHSSAQLAARAGSMGELLGHDEQRTQARDLTILRQHGHSLVLPHESATDDEAAAAAELIRRLREPAI